MNSLATFLTFALVIVCVCGYIKLMRKYNTAVYYVIGAATILGGWLIIYNYIYAKILGTIEFLCRFIAIALGWSL